MGEVSLAAPMRRGSRTTSRAKIIRNSGQHQQHAGGEPRNGTPPPAPVRGRARRVAPSAGDDCAGDDEGDQNAPYEPIEPDRECHETLLWQCL